MEINPGMAALLGLVVWVLGLAYKYVGWRPGWDPDSKRMVSLVLALSVALGLVQAGIQSQLTPLPAPPVDMVQLVFVWVPRVLAWLALTVGAVFAASQGIYVLIRRVVFGRS